MEKVLDGQPRAMEAQLSPPLMIVVDIDETLMMVEWERILEKRLDLWTPNSKEIREGKEVKAKDNFEG